MSELRLIPSRASIGKTPVNGGPPVSDAERELNSFVNSVAGLIGPGASRSLSELWLAELACMEYIPGSEGFSWRSVSLSASVKLASQLIASQLSVT